ncbi:MAG: hypothetical protein P9L99_14855 [Candidatus Lernaella stagnicola]|nr:hypothetical protein [Candidatus Lernaella stagnicola]
MRLLMAKIDPVRSPTGLGFWFFAQRGDRTQRLRAELAAVVAADTRFGALIKRWCQLEPGTTVFVFQAPIPEPVVFHERRGDGGQGYRNLEDRIDSWRREYPPIPERREIVTLASGCCAADPATNGDPADHPAALLFRALAEHRFMDQNPASENEGAERTLGSRQRRKEPTPGRPALADLVSEVHRILILERPEPVALAWRPAATIHEAMADVLKTVGRLDGSWTRFFSQEGEALLGELVYDALGCTVSANQHRKLIARLRRLP